ncbi:MAG: peptidoglycan-binding domain-containing protein [Acidimicrobiales bacterium]
MPQRTWDLLKQGDHGDAVTALQYLLRAHGYGIAADGDFGPQTDNAVRQFQTARNLAVDGQVGNQTWPQVTITVASGSTGDAVRAVQCLKLILYPDQPALVVDGSFGPETEERVRMFQGQWGLGVDGIVGTGTWFYLVSRRLKLWPLVKQGSHNETAVRAVQHLLRARGATIAADGVFGPVTAAAVSQFQTEQGMMADGIVDTATWPKLVIQVGPGATGEAVKAVQWFFSHTLAVDGIFGPQTEKVVKEFQAMWGLAADGIVGPLTWYTLMVPKFD